MIVSDKNQFIFVKTRKTCSSSIEYNLSKECSKNDIITSIYPPINGHKPTAKGRNWNCHTKAKTIRRKLPNKWKNYKTFGFVRNPWDHAVSQFWWSTRKDTPRVINVRQTKLRFKQWITSEYSNYFVKNQIADNTDLLTSKRKLIVDFVGRYETVERDYEEICRLAGLEYLVLPKIKSETRKIKNHYSDYYDSRTRQIVEQANKQCINLFGYKFRN